MPSYLDNTYLGDLSDEFGDEFDADNATSPLSPATNELADVPAEQYVTLPGGIIIKRQTLLLLAAIVAGIALYVYAQKKKKAD